MKMNGLGRARMRFAYPPMPQQLGSVTFSAADTATAASAMHAYRVRNTSASGTRVVRTGVAAFAQDLETSLARERL
jgi:hypothetical protein